MKILFLGDTHGDIEHVLYAVGVAAKTNCDQIIQVGDFGFFDTVKSWEFVNQISEAVDGLMIEIDGREPFTKSIPFYFIDGNHDHHQVLQHDAVLPQALAKNVSYLPRGFTWMCEGRKFIALGGAHSVDQYRRTEYVDWWNNETIGYKDVGRTLLNAQGYADVLVCHDAPIGVENRHLAINHDTDKGFYNRTALQEVADALNVKLIVHGHHHNKYSIFQGDRHIVGLNCNYKPEDSFWVWDSEWLGRSEVGDIVFQLDQAMVKTDLSLADLQADAKRIKKKRAIASKARKTKKNGGKNDKK